MTALPARTRSKLPALVAAAGERASLRFLEFFAANIRNPHTRRAYYRAADKFLAWCAEMGVPSIEAVQPRPISRNGETLEKTAAMANHASTRTTQLYDRRRDEVSLDKVERIVI